MLRTVYNSKYMTFWKKKDFPGGSDGKESACNGGNPGQIPGLAKSPGEGQPTPVFLPGEFMDRGA